MILIPPFLVTFLVIYMLAAIGEAWIEHYDTKNRRREYQLRKLRQLEQAQKLRSVELRKPWNAENQEGDTPMF